MNPRGFARGVMEYRILPNRVSYLAGLLLIPTEILLAATHLTGRLLSFGVLLGLVVLACFTAGVALNLRRERRLSMPSLNPSHYVHKVTATAGNSEKESDEKSRFLPRFGGVGGGSW